MSDGYEIATNILKQPTRWKEKTCIMIGWKSNLKGRLKVKYQYNRIEKAPLEWV